jgi:hypothetical protein
MHSRGGRVVPSQVVSSTEVTAELQDFTLDGTGMQFLFKSVLLLPGVSI